MALRFQRLRPSLFHNQAEKVLSNFGKGSQGILALVFMLFVGSPGSLFAQQCSFTAPNDMRVCDQLIIAGGGLPTGGCYSGPGVADGGNGTTYVFNPASAGVGTHVLGYTPPTFSQLGADIDGEAGADGSGYFVSASEDGNRIAIGAPFNDDGGTGGGAAGQVRVYDWNGSAWVQAGGDIDGEDDGDQSGFSVSLSADGLRLAIGAPFNGGNGANSGHVRVYEWNGSAWVQLGLDIDGEDEFDSSGFSVSLSDDGSRLAIGATLNDPSTSSPDLTSAGHVRVYEWNGTAWAQVGADIDGEAMDDRSGSAVSLSEDGSRVAIGAPENNNSGHVRIYEWNGTSWNQIGADIDGPGISKFGTSVSISNNGDRIAIGGPQKLGSISGVQTGGVWVYQWDGTNWVQLGTEIEGVFQGDAWGISVSLSADGRRFAAGATGNDGVTFGNPAIGHTRVFEYNPLSSSWVQKGNTIDGEADGDGSGGAVALSGDGYRLFIGAENNDGTAAEAGHVRAYLLTCTDTIVISDCCPSLGPIMAPNTVCVNDPFDISISGLMDMDSVANSDTDFGIQFIWSGNAQADPYNPTGTTVSLGTVPFGSLTAGNTVAALVGASIPFVDPTGFIYAILSPTPTDTSCNPFVEHTIATTSKPTVDVTLPQTICFQNGTVILGPLTAPAETNTVYSGTGVTDNGNGNDFTFNVGAVGVGVFPVTVTQTNSNGCSRVDIVNVTVNPTDTTNIAATTCDPSMVGVMDTTFTNQFGCDSVIITTTTLLPNDTTNIAARTCDPAMVGVMDTTFVNQFGCDSVVITTTTLLPSDTTNIAATTCDPSMVGVMDTTFTNQFGCDSVIITTTTLLPNDTTNIAATTCDPSMVGVMDTTFVNQFGCDSVIITTTTLLPSDTTNIAATTCDPGMVGVMDTTFMNQFGCDSVIITTTTLLPSDTTNIALTTCDPGMVGVMDTTFTNQFGCDSIIITTTTLLPGPSIICPPDTTILCLDPYDPNSTGFPGVFASCGVLSIVPMDSVVNGSCPNEKNIFRTWTVTDSIDRTASCVQLISIVDTIKPTWVRPLPPRTLIASCGMIPPPDTLMATDNCGGPVSVTFREDTIRNGAGFEYDSLCIRRRWIAEDECGNRRRRTQVIYVVDCPDPCDITGITVGSTMSNDSTNRVMVGPVCNDDGTYNVEICIQWKNNPIPDFIEVEINGTGGFIQIPIDGPQDFPEKCFVLENLPANGRYVTIFARIGREGCTYRARDLFRAPDRCDPPPTDCDITDATIQIDPTCTNGTVSTCIMLEGVNLPTDASNAMAVVGGVMYPISQYRIVTGGAVVCIEGLPADGGNKDLFIKLENGCTITKRAFLQMPRTCDGDPGDDPDDDCDITGIRFSQAECNRDGTYDLEFVVTYNDMPAGQLAVEVGHGSNKSWSYHAVTGSPQTITVAGLPAVGGYANVFVKSNDVGGCTWYERSWYRAPSDCGRARDGEFATNLNQIRVYPNPSEGKFFLLIEQDKEENIEVAVSNSLGQVVKTLKVESNREELLDLSEMPEGIYTLRIMQGEAPVYRQIQVQH